MLVGLAVAVANIDEVIQPIRTAPDPVTAKERLMARDWPAADVAPLIRLIDDPEHPMGEGETYRLSEAQAKAIPDLRLQRLTGLERDKIAEELQGLSTEILDHLKRWRAARSASTSSGTNSSRSKASSAHRAARRSRIPNSSTTSKT